jgi:acyl carrier protein
MSNQERITNIVKKFAQSGGAPDPEESLFASGYLDSFALPDLVGELESEFGIKIPDSDLNPRKFDSIARMESYIESRL